MPNNPLIDADMASEAAQKQLTSLGLMLRALLLKDYHVKVGVSSSIISSCKNPGISIATLSFTYVLEQA